MATVLPIAVVGLGAVAQTVHLPLISRRWDLVELAAIVDHSPRRLGDVARATGLDEDRRFATAENLLAAVKERRIRLGGAVVATTSERADIALAFAERGIPVLLEGPIALSPAHAAKLTAFEQMCGRSLVMMSEPLQYDDAWTDLRSASRIADIRLVQLETVMPSTSALVKHARVTPSSYDVDAERRRVLRGAELDELTDALGAAAGQKDRDLYTKGVLAGVVPQLAALRPAFGEVETIEQARQWPPGVVPGSIAVDGTLASGVRFSATWHYLPFQPEPRHTVTVLASRRTVRAELASPFRIDDRSRWSVTERDDDRVAHRETTAGAGSAERMWETFHAAHTGTSASPVTDARGGEEQLRLGRRLLDAVLMARGRDLDAEAAAAAAEESGGDAAGNTAENTDGDAAENTDGETGGEAGGETLGGTGETAADTAGTAQTTANTGSTAEATEHPAGGSAGGSADPGGAAGTGSPAATGSAALSTPIGTAAAVSVSRAAGDGRSGDAELPADAEIPTEVEIPTDAETPTDVTGSTEDTDSPDSAPSAQSDPAPSDPVPVDSAPSGPDSTGLASSGSASSGAPIEPDADPLEPVPERPALPSDAERTLSPALAHDEPAARPEEGGRA